MPVTLVGLPSHIASALDRLQAELGRTAGPNLVGLILYGGLARGRYRPGKSDVNVLVLLNDASATSLTAIAQALQAAWREVGVQPLILTPSEVQAAAGAFPVKFLDIKAHHVVLSGSSPLVDLVVPREQIRIRTEQELRNHLLRLRNHFALSGRDPVSLTRILSNVARPLALELAALLGLAGMPVPEEDRTAAIYASAAAAFGLKPEPLAQLAALRQNPKPAGDMGALFRDVLDVITQAANAATKMGESPR